MSADIDFGPFNLDVASMAFLACWPMLDYVARRRRWYARAEKAWPAVLDKGPPKLGSLPYRSSDGRGMPRIVRAAGIPWWISFPLCPHALEAVLSFFLFWFQLMQTSPRVWYPDDRDYRAGVFLVGLQMATAISAIVATIKRRPWLMLLATLGSWSQNAIEYPYPDFPGLSMMPLLRAWLFVAFVICHWDRSVAERRARAVMSAR